MSKRCIINVAVGQWYPRGLARLRKSLSDVGFDGEFIGWDNCYPPGSPKHEDVPDAFKSYAFQDALRKGYTSILWLDASCWAIKPVEPIFDWIEKHGHLFYYNGHNIGEWCKDSAVEKLHMTREGSFSLSDLNGMFLGIDYTNPRTKAWLDEFCEICQDGETLIGPFWPRPKPGEISSDPRVLGHAHEQTVAGALAHHHGMPFTRYVETDANGISRRHFLQVKYPTDPVFDETIIMAAGM